MSDYYGSATLEDWLYEEVFAGKVPSLTKSEDIPRHIVTMFEKWREGIERSIESWMESDDGYGNNLSWRDWGRGFYGIPDEDDEVYTELAGIAITLMKFNPVIEECNQGHKFAKLEDHPLNDLGQARCPHCLSIGFDKKTKELDDITAAYKLNIVAE